jgi:hypothetical protein
MNVADATSSSGDSPAAEYEELRSHVRAGSAFGSHLGLVLLLREGLAAWMARCSATRVEPTANPERPAVAPVVTDEIHAGLVRVLANIALAGREELRA